VIEGLRMIRDIILFRPGP